VCVVVVDLLNTIFFLSSFIDIAVNFDDINCTNYLDSYCDIHGCNARNLYAAITLCHEIQAASGITAISFLLWLISSIWVIRFIVVGYRRNRDFERAVDRMRANAEEEMTQSTRPQINTISESTPRRTMEDADV